MSIWQSMAAISENQISEIKDNPKLLDAFCYFIGLRSTTEYLADIQDAETHNIIPTNSGYIIAPKNSGITITNAAVPSPPVPWYRNLFNFFTRHSAPRKIQKPKPPEIPTHWIPFTNEDRCDLDQQFDFIFYLFADGELPGTFPLNFMAVPRHPLVSSKEYGYFTPSEVAEIVSGIDAVSEDVLRSKFGNLKRIEALGCSWASGCEDDNYDDYIGGMITAMRQFVHHCKAKKCGIFLTLN